MAEAGVENPSSSLKRKMEEEPEEGQDVAATAEVGEEAPAAKEPKAEKPEEEEEEKEEEEEEEGDIQEVKEARLGPKTFTSAVEMFDYFYALLRDWSPNIDINKYEHMVLLDLLKKGNPEADKKIGPGIEAFEVRFHPVWKNRCFFLRRVDGSSDDFSFRKCVDNIMPLPENMKIKPAGGHHNGGRGHGGRGGGRGRGGRGRGRRGR